jgi:hypothetical protein
VVSVNMKAGLTLLAHSDKFATHQQLQHCKGAPESGESHHDGERHECRYGRPDE